MVLNNVWGRRLGLNATTMHNRRPKEARGCSDRHSPPTKSESGSGTTFTRITSLSGTMRSMTGSTTTNFAKSGTVGDLETIVSPTLHLKLSPSGNNCSMGNWLTAPFNLTSHMTLFLGEGAVILGIGDEKYWPLMPPLPSYGYGREHPIWKFNPRTESKRCCNYSASLKTYAYEDTSVGSWMIGHQVTYIDETRLCCFYTEQASRSQKPASRIFHAKSLRSFARNMGCLVMHIVLGANVMTIRTLRNGALQVRDLTKPVPKNLVWEAVNTHG